MKKEWIDAGKTCGNCGYFLQKRLYLESKNPTCPSLITISKIAKALKITPSKLIE